MSKQTVTLEKKWLLTVPEACEITGIGINRMRQDILSNPEYADQFTIQIGSQVRIKADKLKEFLYERHFL